MEKNMKTAISNLYAISSVLEKASMDPKNYNTDFSYYLEQMSWGMFKDARELEARLEICVGY